MSNIPNFDESRLQDPKSVFEKAVMNFLKTWLFTAIPVQVVAVNNNKVDLKPVLEQLDTSGKAIDITNDDIIANIPIMMLFGGQCQISFKPAINDFGLLIACKSDMTNFIANRSVSEVASNRLFSLSNGFYLPLDFQNVDDEVLIKNSNSTITLTSTAINISNSTGEINIDSAGLLQLKNTAQSLFTLLNTLLTTLIALKTGLTPSTPTMVIDTATSTALSTLQTNLALLLKA